MHSKRLTKNTPLPREELVVTSATILTIGSKTAHISKEQPIVERPEELFQQEDESGLKRITIPVEKISLKSLPAVTTDFLEDVEAEAEDHEEEKDPLEATGEVCQGRFVTTIVENG